MAKRATKSRATEYLVVVRFRNVVNGPWFEEGRIVEVGIDLTQAEIDMLVRARHLERT